MESTWEVVARTVASEFSDLPDVEQFTRLLVRLVLSAVLGGLLGMERELHGKAAGVRTHMLVSLGAALFVLVPQQAGMDPADLSRVIQGVVAGVGFLCAGTILKLGDGNGNASVGDDHVKGLTTAAGLWLTAAIGIASGLGREMTALLTTLLAIGILSLEGPIRRHLPQGRGGGNPKE
jgi:putative Mg2+ transporter-C (MgtC) family protein